jgi:hypothetical protein
LVARHFFNVYRFFMIVPARLGLKLVAGLLAALVLLYGALWLVFNSEIFRHWARAQLSARSGWDVRLENLSLQPPFHVVAGAVEISKPGEFSFKSDRLTLTVTPLDLWSHTLQGLKAERPVLEIDIDELMKPAKASGAEFGLRRLNILDGSIVLKKGAAVVFELPNVNLTAENLNLGQQSGIDLRADVPPLNGAAELQLSGQMRALEVGLVLRSKKKPPFPRDQGETNAELVRLHAKIDAPENQPANILLQGQFKDFAAAERRFSGTLGARAVIDREWKTADFSGRAVLSDLRASLGPMAAKLPQGDASADFSGAYSLPNKILTLKSIAVDSPLGKGVGQGVAILTPEARISNAKLLWRDIPLENLRASLPAPLSDWRIQGRGQVDLELTGSFRAPSAKGVARGDAVTLQGSDLSLANLNFTAPLEWSPSVLHIREAKLVGTKLSYGGKDRWQMAAERMQVIASTDLPAAELLRISGSLATAGGKFSSPDNSKVGENLAIQGPFQLAWRGAKNTATISGNITAEGGEILWGKFFADLKAPKPALEMDADYAGAEDRLDCRRCVLKLQRIGGVETAGSIARFTQSPDLNLLARSTEILPGGVFETFLRENLKRQFPALDKLLVAGQLSFQTQLRGSLENLAIGGVLSLKSGELRSASNDWEVAGIALDLPLQLDWGATKTAGGEGTRAGTLSIKSARMGEVAVSPFKAAVSLSHNELRFHEPLRAAVFGGEILVGNLVWPDIIKTPQQLTFSVDSKRLQLQELTKLFGWPRFSGTLTGSIPEVQSTDHTLKTNGEIQAELFGGRVRMSKLEIENPFSSLAAIRLDATLANIDLEQLSKTFEFGRISGMLEGTIADLIITSGQPAQFGADLHTVDRGTEQRISVEALNKITVLSSGESAGALYGGLAGFFDSFRYSKLGFKAILRNDRLTLRGVETRGNQEYLVVGSLLPPTVNVISHTQTIGFSELLRRLERIKADKPQTK